MRVQRFTGDEVLQHFHRPYKYYLYADNPLKIEVITMSESDGSYAQGVLWKLDDGREFLEDSAIDRRESLSLLHRYARERGMILRGEIDPFKLGSITLVKPHNDLWPTPSTFAFGRDVDDAHVQLFPQSTMACTFALMDSDGERIHYNPCELCGGFVDPLYDKVVVIELKGKNISICEACFDERRKQCRRA